MQEVAATKSQWIVISRYAQKLGYVGYYVGAIEDGAKKRRTQWHRGVITLVSENIPSKWCDDVTWEHGQLLTVVVADILVTNSYVTPSEEHIAEHAGRLEQSMLRLQWQGRWLWTGDWNEVYSNSWIATSACMFCGEQADCSHLSSTRWEGSRVIGYPIANFQVSPCEVREEAISDHRIVQFRFTAKAPQRKQHYRFIPEKQFLRPSWISPRRWKDLFAEAVNQEADMGWIEACRLVEEFSDWQPEEGEEDQVMVDYLWTLVCAQMTTAFRTALRLALFELPNACKDFMEMTNVLHQINQRSIKGASIRTQQRIMPKGGCSKLRIQLAKLSRRLGRLKELVQRFKKQKLDSETYNLEKKLYGARKVTLAEAEGDMKMASKELNCLLESDRREKLSQWKQTMKTSRPSRADWINRKGGALSPTVVKEDKVAMDKMEAVGMIHDYWIDLWRNQDCWNEDVLQQRTEEITNTLQEDFDRVDLGGCDVRRPGLSLFTKRLLAINGCPGPDGWGREEMKIVASCNTMAGLVWKCMQFWEHTACVPRVLQNCKLCCIPKKDQRQLKPCQFRPICVFSIWWRAWSSTWLRAEVNKKWIQEVFPMNVAGGLQGSPGPEEIASVVAHQLAHLGYGVSLDLSHAFDAVDLKMMDGALSALLPEECRPWKTLLLRQWCNMQRWIVHDKAVAPSPIVVPHGIPQGDPAGPVIMNLLMYSLKKMVDSRMSKDPQDFFHVLYMDDRTYVGRTKAIVGEAQQVWAETAMRYKLKENMEKAQHVATNGNKILEQLGIEVQQCLLDSSVKHFLGGLDWVQRGDIFEHEFLRESFTLEHIADLQQWKRVAHVLRESFRLQSYDQFWIVQRHEIIGKRKPLYRGCRRELVLKWINCDSTAFLAAIGAIRARS